MLMAFMEDRALALQEKIGTLLSNPTQHLRYGTKNNLSPSCETKAIIVIFREEYRNI